MANVPQQTIEKWQKVANLLIKLTRTGSLKWQETAKSGKYLTSLGDKTISIWEYYGPGESGDEVPFIKIQILDLLDDEIDSFNDEDLGAGFYADLRDLLRKIERDATGAEKAIDELLIDLEKLDLDNSPF